MIGSGGIRAVEAALSSEGGTGGRASTECPVRIAEIVHLTLGRRVPA